jgi:hypothetical protein
MENFEDSSLANQQPGYVTRIQNFETELLNFIAQQNLPTESVFIGIDERIVVFQTITRVLDRIPAEQKPRSIYISKFIAAIAAGLFDAALNYLWDETVLELRNRVSKYDLSYFYDNAVSPEKRKRLGLNEESDLVKVDDSELIEGGKKIGLISELGYKHLDFIRYMRNWVSAAHPNQNEISGLQVVGWLETCIKEVIALPWSSGVVEIQKLLKNIKTRPISETEARQTATFFLELSQEPVNNLASGFFGIYVRADTTSQTRENIHRLLPFLWDRVNEQTKQGFGVKYGRFIASSDQDEANLARQFLEVVSGVSYIPDTLRAAEIDVDIDNLLSAHRGGNNFYNEPAFARALQRVVGEGGSVPPQVKEKYTLAVVEAYLTNGNGKAWNADPIYVSMMNQFDASQALIAVLSFNDPQISKKLPYSLCQERYRSILRMMKTKVSAAAVRELIEEIENDKGPLEKLQIQTAIKRKVENLKKIMG